MSSILQLFLSEVTGNIQDILFITNHNGNILRKLKQNTVIFSFQQVSVNPPQWKSYFQNILSTE